MRDDLIIRNASIIDGSGRPPYTADLAIRGARIAAMGPNLDTGARRELDARGKVLAPGFIDVHTHDDHVVLSDPEHLCKTSQGVTTVVTGNCGISIAPLTLDKAPPPPLDLLSSDPAHFFGTFSDYVSRLEDQPAAVNVAPQVGHSTLRVATMAALDRPADPRELGAMCKLLEASLDAGAIGMSTGLFYRTADAATTEEVTALSRIMADRQGVYTTHMRDESDHIADSLRESFAIGREAGVPVVISHHKCCGTRNFGRAPETLAMIDEAHLSHPVGLDVYPYAAASSVLDVEKFNDATRIMVSWSLADPGAAGRDLAELAREAGISLQDMADRLQPAGGIYFMMDEDDVRTILAHPRSMIGSDGLPGDTHPHPRLWGTFPRVLGHYARDQGLFPLEIAVHKMTGLSAATFGLQDRGLLQPGYYADLVLFDASTVADTATFDTPQQRAEGIAAVFVNGRTVYENGASTGARPGRVLGRG